jgi:NAD(P)H-hydrate epimerase
MATAGSGDVLSGILAALCGGPAAADLAFAAAAGAYINGAAGEHAQRRYGEVSMGAGDTAEAVKDVILSLTRPSA